MTGPRSLGIDIGGTSVKVALVDSTGIIARGQSRHYTLPDTETLRNSVQQALDGIEAESATVWGICAPGVFDAQCQRIVKAINVPGLVGVDLASMCRTDAQTSKSITVTTDAHAAAYGHWHQHPHPGRTLSLIIGTGVGCCVLDNGKQLLVTGQSCGHLGQIDVGQLDSSPQVAPDGSLNTLESYLGLHARQTRYGNDPLGQLLEAPISDAPWLALIRTIRIVHAVYRPQSIVLLGGIGSRLEQRLEELKSAVLAGLTSVAFDGWTLTAGVDQTGACGVAWLAMFHDPQKP